jgi:hypothetical protein
MKIQVKIKHVNPSVAPQIFVYLIYKDFESLSVVNKYFYLLHKICLTRPGGPFLLKEVSLKKQNDGLHLIQ